jgi:hypothetical protein
MTNLITGIIGLAMMATFLGFLLWWLKALPLTIIMVFVIILAAVDFVQSLRAASNGSGH